MGNGKVARIHGMSPREAKHAPRRRSDLDTSWHDWKQEGYMSPENAITTNRQALDSLTNVQQSNIFVSPMTRLPPEILDLILTFLPRDAELSLRLSCPEVYNGCGSQPMFSLVYTLCANADHQVRQRSRWIYNCWIQSYNKKRSLITTLPCYSCGILHPKLFFSETEAAKESGTRSCLGWTRKLYLTPHSWISYQHIFEARKKWDKRGFQKQISSPTRCGLVATKDTAEEGNNARPVLLRIEGLELVWPTPAHLSPLIWDFHPFRLNYCIRFHFLRQTLSGHASLARFGDQPFKFCPHMGPAALEIGSLVQGQLKKRGKRLHCQECKTVVAVQYSRVFPTLLDAHVTKIVGDLFSALDPVWLAHLT